MTTGGPARLVIWTLAAALALLLPGPPSAATPAGSTPATPPPEARAGSCSMYPIAHRGEHHRHDENTLGAVRAVRHAEVDLRLTRDKRFILMHDKRLDRTTNGTGYVQRRRWAYIRSLRTQPHGARVPTLNRVLDVVQNRRTMLLVEIKNYPAYWSRRQLRAVARQIRRHQVVGRVYLGGYGVLRALPSVAPRIRSYWSPSEGDEISADAVRDASAQAALAQPSEWTRAKVRNVNEGGFLAWARRGKKPTGLTRTEYWARIEQTGVQGAFTDAPKAMREWCRRRG